MYNARLCMIFLFFLAIGTDPALAGEYSYISPEALKAQIENDTPLHLVDIQVEEEFAAHHLPGAIETCAYPVKSDSDKHKLHKFVAELKKDALPVVIVCPRGGGGAKRAVKYLEAEGIAESRLLILEKGQQGWPYKDMIEGK